MKTHILIPAIIVLQIVLFASCTDGAGIKNELDDVESYIQDRPDSALAVLEKIDSSVVKSKSTRAKFSLLYAMALDKNYVDTTDMSVIKPAIDYYSRLGTVDEKMKAYYSEGIIYFNRKEYDNAIVSLSNAESLIQNATDLQYVGLVYLAISDVYNRTHLPEEEIKYVKLAADAFDRWGKSGYYHSTLYRMAQAYTNARRYDEAGPLYEQLLSDLSTPEYIVRYVKEDYALVLLSGPKKDNERALSYMQEVVSEYGYLRNTNLYAAYAYALSACGHTNEAEAIYSQLYSLDGKDYSIVDIWKSATYEKMGDYKEAYSLLQKSLTYQDSLLNITLSHSTVRAQKDFFALKNSKMLLEQKTKQYEVLIVLVALIVLIVVLLVIIRQRTELFRKERIKIAEIAESMRTRLKESEETRILLRQEIASKEQTLSKLRTEYSFIYKNQFKRLGELCETFLLANERRDSQRIVYEKVHELIKDINGDKAGHERFESMVNKSLEDIMIHFREDFPSLKEEDYRFVCYTFVGFDATTLCIIFNMPSLASVYTRKSRIKKKIQESSVSFKKDYLDHIG
jgi:tetratricopeptide (TPR) repeat protein